MTIIRGGGGGGGEPGWGGGKWAVRICPTYSIRTIMIMGSVHACLITQEWTDRQTTINMTLYYLHLCSYFGISALTSILMCSGCALELSPQRLTAIMLTLYIPSLKLIEIMVSFVEYTLSPG